MSVFEKQRWEVWNLGQHPYKHSLSEFSFVNPALPGVSNVEGAINWILAVLYPNTKEAVATPGDLPLVGNTLNDYRVVFDDGDGKAAAYRWEQREGEVSSSWHKIYDMDWGQDSILAAYLQMTQDLYVWRDGRDQLDANGNVITGTFAGQTIYGGKTANTNLTLNANFGDGVGPQTGFVQVNNNFRPVVDGLYNLGTLTERFNDLFLENSASIGTMTISSGVITDSSGAISFGNEDLSTTGDITATNLFALDSATVDTMFFSSGSITDTTGAIDFGNENLSTTGTLAAGVTTLTDGGATIVFDPDVSGVARITASSGTISFDNENLTTTGAITGGAITGTQLNVDNLRLDGNTVSSTDTNGNIILLPNGTGFVDVQKSIRTLDQVVNGTVGITGVANVDNLRLDGNTLSVTNTNGNLLLQANGTGQITFDHLIRPTNNNVLSIGTATNRISTLFLGTSISNGTTSILTTDIFSLRNNLFRDVARTQPAQNGDSLFYDSVNGVWLASVPDSEITHGQLTGLTTGDAGHTQFALLTGRPGGQIIQGGTQASNNLILESTSNATKGNVLTRDTFLPFTNSSYSSVWNGLDVGGTSNYFRHTYTKGEHFGLRLENVTSGTLPVSSAQNVGRLVYTTDTRKAYVDTGATILEISKLKYLADQTFNGVITQLDVNVSASVTDARNCQWQLLDNSNNYETMYVRVLKTSATNVRIITNVPLPAGSYRLIGME